jgi:hypothetical protein
MRLLVSGLDTELVDSLKALDPERPIREADILANSLAEGYAGSLKAHGLNDCAYSRADPCRYCHRKGTPEHHPYRGP